MELNSLQSAPAPGLTADSPAETAAGETPASRQVAAELRSHLTALLSQMVGTPARPVGLTRQYGIDKSLASRLVKATKSDSPEEFLHLVPSPTGLRMLLVAARGRVEEALVAPVEASVDRFQGLLDATPGGRQGLDAKLGEGSAAIHVKREHMARQASFKAVSFLFGHYSETLATAIFIVPRADGVSTDMIEVHRRIGWHRVTPGTSMPLLSLHTFGSESDPDSGPHMTSIEGDARTQDARDFLMVESSSSPLPQLSVEREGQTTTFILPGDLSERPPERLTTAFRVAKAQPVAIEATSLRIRSYMLNTPCHRLIRDIYVADGLWPRAEPLVAFYLPGPSGATLGVPDPQRRHYRQLNLTARVEALAAGAKGMAIPGVPDQAGALESVLARAGLAGLSFRGWRCEMAYPVPLIEMQISMRLA